MPRRAFEMHDDGLHVPIATGSALMVYGWTLQDIVLILWTAYVFVLIIIKLPELTGSLARIRACVADRWAMWRGRDGD